MQVGYHVLNGTGTTDHGESNILVDDFAFVGLQTAGTERDAFDYHLDAFVFQIHQAFVTLHVVKVFQDVLVALYRQRSIERETFVIVEDRIYILYVDAEIFGQVGIFATDFQS